jgi:hypothetical protein
MRRLWRRARDAEMTPALRGEGVFSSRMEGNAISVNLNRGLTLEFRGVGSLGLSGGMNREMGHR